MPLIPENSIMSIESGEILFRGKPEYRKEEDRKKLFLDVARAVFDSVESFYRSELGDNLPQKVGKTRTNESGLEEQIFQINVKGTEAAIITYDLLGIRYRIFHPELRLEP